MKGQSTVLIPTAAVDTARSAAPAYPRDDDFESGGGAYRDGVIRVSNQDIQKPGEALNVTLGHELTHAEQDYLKICQAADRLKIGKVPTKQEALKLAEELKTLDEDYVNNNYALLPFAEDALVKRNGVQLNAAENIRANLLGKAADSYTRTTGRLDLISDTATKISTGRSGSTGQLPIIIGYVNKSQKVARNRYAFPRSSGSYR
jgi:hypothetical protein